MLAIRPGWCRHSNRISRVAKTPWLPDAQTGRFGLDAEKREGQNEGEKMRVEIGVERAEGALEVPRLCATGADAVGQVAKR